jgi:hypothetical protein
MIAQELSARFWTLPRTAHSRNATASSNVLNNPPPKLSISASGTPSFIRIPRLMAEWEGKNPSFSAFPRFTSATRILRARPAL